MLSNKLSSGLVLSAAFGFSLKDSAFKLSHFNYLLTDSPKVLNFIVNCVVFYSRLCLQYIRTLSFIIIKKLFHFSFTPSFIYENKILNTQLFLNSNFNIP